MTNHDDDHRFSLLDGTVPIGFVRNVVTLKPGGWRGYNADEWKDALVVVEQGVIDIESVGGDRLTFVQGAVLILHDMSIRAISNAGTVDAVLASLRRRRRSASSNPRKRPRP